MLSDPEGQLDSEITQMNFAKIASEENLLTGAGSGPIVLRWLT